MNNDRLLLRPGQLGFGTYLNDIREDQGYTIVSLAVGLGTPENLVSHRVGQLKRLFRSECKNIGLLFAVCAFLGLKIPFSLTKAGWDPEKP